ICFLVQACSHPCIVISPTDGFKCARSKPNDVTNNGVSGGFVLSTIISSLFRILISVEYMRLFMQNVFCIN
ncbi:hypothetical protein L9F63_021349, partial [Diploptera punctata]